jgi:hypothetical protein
VAGLLMVVAVGQVTSGQGFPKPTVQEGPVEIRGNVTVTGGVDATQSGQWAVLQSGRWTVSLDDRTTVHLATPSFIERDRTYEIRWSEADRWERYRVVNVLSDGWVLADALSPGAARGQQYVNLARAVAVVRVGTERAGM